MAEHIRTCSDRPSMAFSEARRFQPEVRNDWKEINIQAVSQVHFQCNTSVIDFTIGLDGQSLILEVYPAYGPLRGTPFHRRRGARRGKYYNPARKNVY